MRDDDRRRERNFLLHTNCTSTFHRDCTVRSASYDVPCNDNRYQSYMYVASIVMLCTTVYSIRPIIYVPDFYFFYYPHKGSFGYNFINYFL
jgi:hypothetical protein